MHNLSAAEIAERLPWPHLIDVLGAGLSAPVIAPARHYHYLEDNSDFLLLMPAWGGRWIGVKISGIFPDNPARGAEVVAESYILIDRTTGQTAALLDGLELTNRRTAAASALAARALAREDAETLLVMGTGSLSRYVAEAHASVRTYRRILIWGRSPAKAAAVVDQLVAVGLPAEVAVDAEAAVRAAGVVSCATGAETPIVHGAWLKPGTHLDLIGAHRPHHREADSDAVAHALIYADVRENVLREAGDILIPINEDRIDPTAIKGELADLVGKRPEQLRTPESITLFKSVGFAAEDLIAAIAAVDF